jgi:DNA-binding NarL/FixJ family response regulator
MIRLFIVDDHAVFREGLKTVLLRDQEIQLAGEADDGRGVVDEVLKAMPDVILMDINMPYSGLQATIDILKKMPDMKILILTVSESEYDLYKAIKSGARGYLLKGMSIKELITAVRSVAAGEAVFTPAMAREMLDDFQDSIKSENDEERISERELQILQLVATGAMNKEIAFQLEISEATVKNHMSHILRKLHLKNRSQVAVYVSDKLKNDRQPQN